MDRGRRLQHNKHRTVTLDDVRSRVCTALDNTYVDDPGLLSRWKAQLRAEYFATRGN